MGCQHLLDRLASGEFFQDQFNGDACSRDYGLAHEHCGVGSNQAGFHVLSFANRFTVVLRDSSFHEHIGSYFISFMPGAARIGYRLVRSTALPVRDDSKMPKMIFIVSRLSRPLLVGSSPVRQQSPKCRISFTIGVGVGRSV